MIKEVFLSWILIRSHDGQERGPKVSSPIALLRASEWLSQLCQEWLDQFFHQCRHCHGLSGRQDQGHPWALVTRAPTYINVAPSHIRAIILLMFFSIYRGHGPHMASDSLYQYGSLRKQSPGASASYWLTAQPTYIHMDLMLHPILGAATWTADTNVLSSGFWNTGVLQLGPIQNVNFVHLRTLFFPEPGWSCSQEASSDWESESA